MQHISKILVDICNQQLLFQAQLTHIDGQIRQLSDSPRIDTQATLPMLHDEFHTLSRFNKRISQRISAASRHP
jgi:hypothetical protein